MYIEYGVTNNRFYFSVVYPHPEANYPPEQSIKIEPGLVPQPPPTEPWQYNQPQQHQPTKQQQQLSPPPQVMIIDQSLKIEPLHSVPDVVLSPEKNSYPRSDSRPSYRDSRERRHVSPGYEDRTREDRTHRRSRSGSRGKDWKDWGSNGRRSDSGKTKQ